MCEINPKHKMIMRLEFFTSNPNLSKEGWEQLVAEKALAMEMLGNMDGQLRVHIHEVPPKIMTHGRSVDCPMVQRGEWTRCMGHEVIE